MPARFPVQWRPRAEPLAPAAVLGFDAAARRLATRVLQLDDATLARLHGVAGDRWIAVLGDSDVLPWADGVAYVGRAPDAPSLLLPTSLEPMVGGALFERAIARAPGGEPPMAISPDRRLVVCVAGARPIDRQRLGQWLARCEIP
jgi:MoxR-vWA-beta-propeller ternary system domain bpX5